EERDAGPEGSRRARRGADQDRRLRALRARRGRRPHRSGGGLTRGRRAASAGGIFVMAEPAYRRVMVKLSGEALAGPDGHGIHQPTVDRFAADLVGSRGLHVALGVVVGGGNLLRGVTAAGATLPRPTADAMGMMATVMNALALEAAIERAGASARTVSALAMP